MKKVVLIVTTTKINGEVLPLDYREQLIGLISNPTDGMNLVTMRRIEKVYDKLDAADCPGHVLLEDAEHATMKEILEKIIYKTFSKGIKDMVEAVIASEDYKVEPLEFPTIETSG